MRFIHTADWHLGKKLHERSLLDDQAHILNELLKVIDDKKPEAIIIAGDIYDSSMPTSNAVDLFDEVLTKIILEKKVPVLCIAGNHDSSSRLNFGSKLFESNRFFLRSKIFMDSSPVILSDDYGPIYFSLIPYFYPTKVREVFNIQKYLSYDESAKILINDSLKRINPKHRKVAIAHLFITGSKRSDSEVEMVGGLDEINAEHFADFNYVALGHLHQPQFKSNNIRYSGSLLKYSVAEEHQPKGIDIVELDGNGKVEVESLPLKPLHDVRTISGYLNDILQTQNKSTDYILVKLKDENPYNAGEILRREKFTNLLGIEDISEREIQASKSIKERENLNDAELFETFFKDMTGRSMNDDELKAFYECFNEVKKSETD